MSQLSLRLVPPADPGVVRAYRSGEERVPAEPRLAEPREAPRAGGRAEAIERLRALVGGHTRHGVLPRPAVPASCVAPGCVPTGIAGLDAWLQGWPRSGPIEISGAIGAGRLALVTPSVARATRQGRSVLFVDPLHQLHPPGLAGVDLARVVLVRAPGERASWVAEQVARSGAVDTLVLLDAPAVGRGGVRLARAAEAGGMLVFVIAERADPELPAALRLESRGWRGGRVSVRCTRCRDGRKVGERWIDPGEAPVELSEAGGAYTSIRLVGNG